MPGASSCLSVCPQVLTLLPADGWVGNLTYGPKYILCCWQTCTSTILADINHCCLSNVNTSVFHIVGCDVRSSTPKGNSLLRFHGNIGYVKVPHVKLHERCQACLTFYVVRELSAKIWSACGQHNIQYTERRMNTYTYNYVQYNFFICLYRDHAVAQLVETLGAKPEDRGFDSRWCHSSLT